MPQCQAIKQDFQQCTRNAWNETEYCNAHIGLHRRRAEQFGPRQEGMCHVSSTQGRCTLPHEPGQMLCMTHRHARERRIAHRAEQQQQDMDIRETYEQYMAHDPHLRWQEVLLDLMNRSGLPPGFPGYISRTVAMRVGHQYFTNPEINPDHFENDRFFWRTWGWLRQGGPERGLPVPLPENEPAQGAVPPPPPPPANLPRLQALAGDAQNVHTREVSEQTNESTRTLLEVTVPLTQKTEQTMMTSWYALPNPPVYSKFLKVANDVNKWFLTDTCRQQGDKLYKRILRGLVAYIGAVQDRESRQELWMRLWEECEESVGMCCEGHISRLCNVLVGFDDAFQPPISFADLLQAKMAAISMMDVPTDEKIQHANSFFNEYAIPQTQRQAWLDAF